MYHLTEAYLMTLILVLLGCLLGALTFSAAVVAPLVVRTLQSDSASLFLRPFWQKYHQFAVLASLVLTTIGTLAAPFSALPAVYTVLLTSLGALMTVCFYIGLQLIPKINLASDNKDTKRFMVLHRADMALVATGLITCMIIIIAIGYVLPGHFTFWQH